MNHQCVSEIVFEESYTVPADQTARALAARLPHSNGYSQDMIDCLATGYLVALLESICVRDVHRHIDALDEIVVGRTVSIEHRAPIPPGSRLHVNGRVQTHRARSVTFCVQALDDQEVVCVATITLVVVPRASMEMRIASKVNALQLAN